MKKILLAVGLTSLMFASNGYHKGAKQKTIHSQTLPLSQQEIDELVFTREEEKLARDVYLTLYKKWGLNIFKNISKSEQRHMDAIKRMLDKYNIPDPVESTGDVAGVFVNSDIQALYDKLVQTGLKSKIDALKVGATIEDMDIMDIEHAIENSTHSDIINVYKNLQKGSRNHLRAFYYQIKRNGGDYQPQYISQDYFNYIISTPWERGRVR